MLQRVLILVTLVALSGFAPAALRAENASPPEAADEAQIRQEREAAEPLVSTTQPVSRSPKWELQALARIDAGKQAGNSIQVVFDGASIINGWVNPKRGLKIWQERIEPYHAFNFGISGDKTQHVLWRLAHGQAEGMHPKLILLMVGLNNLGSGSTPDQVADGVKEIAVQYRKRCPDAVILIQGLLPRGDTKDAKSVRIRDTNALVESWASANSYLYRDFGSRFLEPDGQLRVDCFINDKTHPNEKGYGIWADAIQDVLDQYAGSTIKQP